VVPIDCGVVDDGALRHEQENAEDIRAATARLLALVGDHVAAGWYVQVVEADAAGRITLFAEAIGRIPDSSSILEANDLVELLPRSAADVVGTGPRRLP
jgi:hypothetical protein